MDIIYCIELFEITWNLSVGGDEKWSIFID